MTPEQKAAYVMAEAASAMARIAGMQAENTMRLALGQIPAYGETAFEDVISHHCISHNAVLALFQS